MKVVFDTNVVISGLLWQGLPNRLLRLVKHGELELCLSRSIVEEVSRVLSEAKFSHRIIVLNTSVEELIAGLSKLSKIYPDEIISPAVKADPDDDRVLSCALTSGAKYIVTGDSHLLELENWSGISILTPRQFLNIIK
ncbi:putative toxin-antitoxin system toxin component, PIN family [Verrucomicrobiota bacterium]